MLPIPLTPEQQLQAEQYSALFVQLAQREAHRFDELLARRPDHELLGPTEFDLRGLVHDLSASFLEATSNGREKEGTGGSARSARRVPRTPAGRASARAPSSACSAR